MRKGLFLLLVFILFFNIISLSIISAVDVQTDAPKIVNNTKETLTSADVKTSLVTNDGKGLWNYIDETVLGFVRKVHPGNLASKM